MEEVGRKIGSDEAIEYLGAIRIALMFGMSGLRHYDNPKARNWLNMFDKAGDFLKGVPTSGVTYKPPHIERVIDNDVDRKFVVSSYEELFRLAKAAKSNEDIDAEELKKAIKSGEQTLDILEKSKEKYIIGNRNTNYAF